jgi:hypothetical protein
MPLDTRLLLQLTASLTNPLALTTVSAPLAYNKQFLLADGVASSQANRLWHSQRTIAPSGTDPLDLAGVLTDPFGAIFTLARIRGLIISADAGNTNNVLVGAGTNPISTMMGGTTPTMIVRPGGMIMLIAPDTTGYAVTAGTGDILQVANSAAGTSVTYDVVVFGGNT